MMQHVQPQPKVKQQLEPITEDMRKKAAEVVKKAKVQLAINHPFFAQLVLNRRVTVSDAVSTAHVTVRGHITIGTRFGAALKVQQVVFLLAHEAMHYAMLHLLRRKYRDPRTWNVACDAVINDLLTNSKCGEFIDGGVNMPGSKDKTSEKVYEELPQQGGKGKGQKSNVSGYKPGEGWDDLNDDDDGQGGLDDSQTRELEEQVRQELAQAAAVAKQQGTLPAGMERLIDDIISPRTPWHILLERFMTRLVKANLSWRRPNRRHMANGFYMPSSDKIPQMGPVVIAVDTSGSIGPELPHFFGHVNRILEVCRPEKVYIMPCDAEVHGVIELTTDDLPVTMDMVSKKGMAKGGGGTSFKPPFRKVQKLGLEPEVLVYLTDMYGDFPEKPAPYDTIWLSTTKDMKAPFGTVIWYECEDSK